MKSTTGLQKGKQVGSKDPKIKVVIPFRDRGIDLRRAANLEVVMAWWWAHGFEPEVVSDGLSGDASFNRHRAYNRAVSGNPDADVLVFTEADMLIHPKQIIRAVHQANEALGLVVPFTQYRYLSDSTTGILRDAFHQMDASNLAEWWSKPVKDGSSVFQFAAESVMGNGKSIGAVNVVSRATLDLTGGFTEATSGNWYDDNIIEEGFAYLAAPTRWVNGPAVHLYHLPGHSGDHLSAKDRQATAHNKVLLLRMRQDIMRRDREAVKRLMSYRSVSMDASL